jgi:hypothetical protein
MKRGETKKLKLFYKKKQNQGKEHQNVIIETEARVIFTNSFYTFFTERRIFHNRLKYWLMARKIFSP